MTIIEAGKIAADKLNQAKVPSAILDAEVLLACTLKKSKEFILANPKLKITKAQEKKYKALVKRRSKFEPVAYLTGEKEFYGLRFLVNKNVLIPRPETELLVEEVIKYVGTKSLTICDVGTGSGAIAVALKKYLPQTKIIATDISKSALNTAKKNADLNKAEISFIKTNLIYNIKDKIDLIAANLPYVPEEEKKIKNVFSKPLKYEPAGALYAGRYGLDSYEKLFQQTSNLPRKPTALFCEIGSNYAQKNKKMAQEYFPQAKIEIKNDLCDKKRLMIIKN
ncbi:MAG: peptide chain release factor N(5)-glutamine methyltransferase [Candidatus Buchananbacteria bacterium]|nr:peptide chain release factor N(5)-glutamine methyltransferase [Candidatus Buchananbacteria bacterium]